MNLTPSSTLVLAELPATTSFSSAFKIISLLRLEILDGVYYLQKSQVSKQDLVQVVGQSLFSL
jgi:hypothetical protein